MAFIGKGTGANLPGRGLINPAFVIKIVPATDDMQQQPTSGRENPNTNRFNNLRVGTKIVAKVGNHEIVGKVFRVITNELGDSTFVKIRDSRGKTYKIQASQIVNTAGPEYDDAQKQLVSSPALFAESKFLSFHEFHKI